MKRRIEILLMVGLLAVALASCQKELKPRGTISQDDALKSELDAKMWSNRMLSSLRYLHGGLYFQAGAEMQGGMLTPKINFGNRYGEMFRNNFNASNEVPNEFYWNHYNVIQNVNFVLDRIDKVVVVNKNEAYRIPLLKGQAHFMRAFCYERLISRFARTEDPSKPGVVLLLHYDMTKQSEKRASQKEVFDQIYADLTKASEFLKDKDVLKKHFYGDEGWPAADEITVHSVIALRARAALTQLNYEEALKNAEQLISSGAYALTNDSSELKAIWHDDYQSKELIMQSYCKLGDEDPNTVSYFLSYIQKYKSYDNDWYPTQDALDLFDSTDVRKNIYFENVPVFFGQKYPRLPGTIVNKFPGAIDLRAVKQIPNSANRPKVFRIAEQYLIAAEAAFKLGDEAKAKTHLNALRNARGLTDVTSAGDELWKEIKDERTRELAYEGFRIVDLRRWGDPIVAQKVQQTIIGVNELLVQNDGRIEATERSFVWPIPSADQLLAGLEQNPGY